MCIEDGVWATEVMLSLAGYNLDFRMKGHSCMKNNHSCINGFFDFQNAIVFLENYNRRRIHDE